MDAIRQQLLDAFDAARLRLLHAEGASPYARARPQEAPTGPGDEMDEAQANENRDQMFAARQRLMEYVRRLMAALDRLQNGRYGICVECAEPISTARLSVLPEAERCVRCQVRLERLDIQLADRAAA